MFRFRCAAAALLALGHANCSKEAPDPGPASGVLKSPDELARACWIWNRKAPLGEAEADHLRSAGVTRIYWHSADVLIVSNVWQFPQEEPVFAPTVPDGFERVPVLRLGASPETASTRGSFPALGEFVAEYLRRDPSATLQIDYDCPDRLLPLYGELLGYIRAIAKPAHLSVTALAGWANKPGFERIQAEADELAVMFYDLRRDVPADIVAGKAIPMVDMETIQTSLPHWRAHCRKPWLAGFPNFSRLSVISDSGHLSGHVHAWNRDALVFHPHLDVTREAQDEGITWLVPRMPSAITDTLTVEPPQQLMLRQPSSESLRAGVRLAADSGASGVVWFPLPEVDGGTGFTATHLAALLENSESAAVPNLSVTHNPTTGVLTLANNGPYDLPARVGGTEGSTDRGWQIEIDGGTDPAFSEASPGGFAQMLGHTDPNSPAPIPASVPAAQRLTFRFASLPAEARLESGPVRFRPGTAPLWRLGRDEWREFAATP